MLPFEYNNGNIPHTNSTPLNSEKEFLYMKATGIVRRIDDLGRVVIPKEIRRTLRIKEGESLEIFTDGTGGVVLKKYSPLGAGQQRRGHVRCDQPSVQGAGAGV